MQRREAGDELARLRLLQERYHERTFSRPGLEARAPVGIIMAVCPRRAGLITLLTICRAS